MIETIFSVSVTFLFQMAEWMGITYELINVIIFCFIWPALTIILCIQNIRLRKEMKSILPN